MSTALNPLRLSSAIVQNGNSKGGSTIWLYDINNKLLRAIAAGEVYHSESYTVYRARLMPLGFPWVFPNLIAGTNAPQPINVNPGSIITFTQSKLNVIIASIIASGQQTGFSLVPDMHPMATAAATAAANKDLSISHAALVAHADTYMDKVLSLARFHAFHGSSKEAFNVDLADKNFGDTLPTKKLSAAQFKLIQDGNQSVQLVGTDAAEADQQIQDETEMLSSCINVRLAAAAQAAHPEEWDISIPEQQVKMTNSSANGLFNFYHTKMGAYTTSSSMTTSQVKNSYNTTTIKLDAMVDIFKSLSLEADKLAELTGAVTTFVESMSTLSSETTDKGLHNAKLTNFFSIQPPVGEPTLAKVAKMRMFYLQFNEATHEWSNSCSSGATYNLDTSIFALDVEINRKICHLTYDHNLQHLLANCDVTGDDITAGGTTGDSDVTIKTDKASSSDLGPAPL